MRALRLLIDQWRWILLLALPMLVCLAADRAPAEELPRYKLAVGQELVYHTTDPPEEWDDGAGGKQSIHNVKKWIADVVDRDAEGTSWVVFRQKITRTNTHGGKDTTQEYESDGHFKLTAEGKFVESATIQPMADPTSIFPTLPPNAASMKEGWEDALRLDETHRKFHASSDITGAEAGQWRFVAEPETALASVYLSKTTRDYLFDRDAGLVRKVVSTSRRGWPEQSAGSDSVQTIELVESRQLPADDTATLAQQAGIYFTAVDDYERIVKKASDDLANTEIYYTSAAAQLKAVGGKLTVPWLKEMLAERLKQHERDLQFAVEDAARFSKLLGQPSEQWKTTDLEDHPRALVDYRGQVVLLDFWYRGCGWCIRAMPQVKQLAEDFTGQPVAIVGVNSDRDLDNTRFVIEHLKLNYPTIKNGEGDEQVSRCYQIRGWPTLVLIDKKGVVRHVHFGYSPTLRSDIGERIRALVAEAAD